MRTGFEVTARSSEPAAFHYHCSTPTNSNQYPLITFAQDSMTQTAVILMGRLYSCPDFSRSHAVIPVSGFASDAALALACFQQQGIQGLTQLEGEFALVLFDLQQRKILALRDPLGSYPLYWCSCKDTVYISTNLRQLAQQIQAGINPGFLASFLTFPYACVELATEQTAFTNIHRVLPGKLLALQPTGQSTVLWSWDWIQQIPNLGTIQTDEADARFLQLFRQVTHDRIRSESFAAHLSGGRDSSSIVCILDQLLAANDSTQNLHTLSLVYQMSSLAGEKQYIQMVIDQSKSICPHFVNGDAALDFDWFTSHHVPEHDEPYAGLFHLAMERVLVDTAHQLGVTTILGGGGAELVTEGNRMYLADLMYQGHWLTMVQQAHRWAQAQNQSFSTVLFRFAIEPLLVLPLQTTLARLQNRCGQFPKLGLFDLPPWIRPEFVKSYALHDRIWATVCEMRQYPVEQSSTLLGLRSAVGNWASWYLGAPLGVRITHPFLDPRLVTFCLGLPRALREEPGIKKPVLHRTMQGILPKPIRTRQFQPSFNHVYWKGLSQNLVSLEAMVQQSQIDKLGIFDKSKLISAMRQQAAGVGDARSGNQINLALALIAWIEHLG